MRVEHEELPTQAFSDPLVGRTIRINKEGPEARTGVLLAVRCDFIVLKTEEDGVVFFVTEHIKSVSEDADENAPPIPFFRHELDAVEEDEFMELLHNMKRRFVRIDRGGVESRAGRLLHVANDHLALFTAEDGVIYYNLEHIRSISEIYPGQQEGDPKIPPPTDPVFIRVHHMHELFHHLKFQWVKINRGGPDKLEGVLVEAKEDQITVVRDRRVHRISTFHLRNISITHPVVEQSESNGRDPGGRSSERSEREQVQSRSDDRFISDDEEKEVRERAETARTRHRQRNSRAARATARSARSTAQAATRQAVQAERRLSEQRSNASALSEIRGGRATRIYFMNH